MIPALPRFQYDTPTIEVKTLDGTVLTLDAAALNAYIRRAESAYNRANVKYCIGQDCPEAGKGRADQEADTDAELFLDCSGFAWWATYRRGVWMHAPGKDPKGKENWIAIEQPIPGATVRYSAAPGSTYGHSGVIIAPGPDNNFQTLDSTNEGPPKASAGSIVYRPDGRAKWLSPKRVNPQFLVSVEAVVGKNGQPFKRPTNLLLAAAIHPIATTGLALVALIGLGYYVYRKRGMA
jgi:hypothetical protein